MLTNCFPREDLAPRFSSTKLKLCKVNAGFVFICDHLIVCYHYFLFLGVTRPDESLFVYQQGQSHSTFHHPNYEPIFPDSQSLDFTDKALEKEAQDICGDSSECMFDIYTTGKVRIGRATKETVKQFVAVVNDTVKPGN